MNRVIAVLSAAVLVGGLSSIANAQSRPVNGAAALSGLQSQAIRISATPVQAPLLNPYERSTIGVSGSFDNQVVYERLNNGTFLVVSPVKDDRELLDNVNAGDTGNNRVQVLFQPTP